MLSHLWACIRGPRVYRIFTPGETELSHPYAPNPLEQGTQQVIKGVSILANIGLYMSPFVLLYLHKRDYTLEMACVTVAKLTAGFTLLVLVCMVIRGIGRSLNPSYNTFLNAIIETNLMHNKTKNLTYSLLAKKYDCDFSAVPVTYKMDSSKPFSVPTSLVQNYLTVGGLVSHAFGRHLIYPGSIRLLQAAIGPYLDEGRNNLMVKNNAKRAKVLTIEENEIDTVFVDRRDRSTPIGDTLVLCCEGNAGFYEVGIVTTPVSAGYSVLGWNLPGFAYSTGLPFPDQVENAVDAVMQFAINSLGFTPDNILVYGWSIGGYPAAWLAKNYPDIRGLILDATFDHVLPLALPRMPGFMGGLVESTIKGHFNLNNGELAAKYYGPITIIRRKQDEIITIIEGDITTNRGNEVVEMILTSRYPELFSHHSAGTALKKYMHCSTDAQKENVLSAFNVNSEDIQPILNSFFDSGPAEFPSSLGKNNAAADNVRIVLYLATKILVDVEGGHPAPLDPSAFKQPWSVVDDASYVQVE
uniref:Protein ABHD16A-like n=1 Tax=Hirondellea gigas TaxID=1518452 RepID=A0A2P2I2X9_9CRUS